MARILCDMDDVINNLTPVWIEELNERYKHLAGYKPVKIDDIKTFDICKYFPALTVEQVFAPLDEPDFYEKLDINPGAARVLKKWIDRGEDVRIATASYYIGIYPKFVAFKKELPFIRWSKHVNVVPTGEKQYILGDFLIDDYPGNLVGGKYQGVLLNKPWNESFDEKEHGFIRAYDWYDIEKIIDKLIEKKNSAR